MRELVGEIDLMKYDIEKSLGRTLLPALRRGFLVDHERVMRLFLTVKMNRPKRFFLSLRLFFIEYTFTHPWSLLTVQSFRYLVSRINYYNCHGVVTYSKFRLFGLRVHSAKISQSGARYRFRMTERRRLVKYRMFNCNFIVTDLHDQRSFPCRNKSNILDLKVTAILNGVIRWIKNVREQ